MREETGKKTEKRKQMGGGMGSLFEKDQSTTGQTLLLQLPKKDI